MIWFIPLEGQSGCLSGRVHVGGGTETSKEVILVVDSFRRYLSCWALLGVQEWWQQNPSPPSSYILVQSTVWPCSRCGWGDGEQLWGCTAHRECLGKGSLQDWWLLQCCYYRNRQTDVETKLLYKRKWGQVYNKWKSKKWERLLAAYMARD